MGLLRNPLRMITASLADIARSTGFAVSTVSRALRDSAEIPLATQKRIKDAARRLKYRPNPLLASLARTRFASRPDDGIPLAYLHLPLPPVDEPVGQNIIKANQAHARKLGYRLEPFLVTDFQDGAQATRILFSRGFQGIILPSSFRFDMLPGMDWSRFSLAGGGGEIIADPLHPFSSLVNHATVDYFRAVLTAWNETRKRGYRRIGFILFKVSSGLVDDDIRWGAAQACLNKIPARNRVPTLLLKGGEDPQNPSKVGRWVRRHRPDAVIGFNGYMAWTLRQVGFRIPEDIAFASLHLETNPEILQIDAGLESGMQSQRLETAFATIELMDQQIRHHEYGLLPLPRVQIIPSKWVDGDSLPLAKLR